MAMSCDSWRKKSLDPLPNSAVQYNPNIILKAASQQLHKHPHSHLLPCAHYGFDKTSGRPIYWEKTGKILFHFKEIKEYFSLQQLLLYYVWNQECFTLRRNYSSQKRCDPVDKCVVVCDMALLPGVLDRDVVGFIKTIIFIGQKYYPETLHKCLVINAPWYFPLLYRLFSSCLSPRTRRKILIAGANPLSLLEQYINRKDIPTEYGGENSYFPWSGPYPVCTGASPAQIDQAVKQPATAGTLSNYHETAALRTALVDEADKHSSQSLESRPTSISLRPSTPLPPVPTVDIEPFECTERPSINSLRPRASTISSISPRRSFRSQASGPYLRDIRIRLAGVKDRGTHHEYMLRVTWKDTTSWVVGKRYSDFLQLRERLREFFTPPSIPPKTIFGKMSQDTVERRTTALLTFLVNAILLCDKESPSDAVKLMMDFLDVARQVNKIRESKDTTEDDESDGDLYEYYTHSRSHSFAALPSPFTSACSGTSTW
eukprot:CAMPEP_0185039246 /NCGR_PEP_ID=MMETSP1103-20130426/35899_1 /TAXON_ID=36769 /ORGANISM="Paraphysomonas bandaiensis, Strain Caron Lab Isolate" /LENGTH=486 /DNA_ID=CAMNT_0027578055 /DNA_START=164 /DNA_END=1621 /DNA_ORIENTATION=-